MALRRISNLVALAAVLTAALVHAAVIDNAIPTHREKDSSGLGGCLNRDDPLTCLGAKTVSVLDRASRMSDIALLPGVTLVKEKDFREGRALMTPAEIEGALPQDPEEKSSRMLDLLYDSGLRFLQSHSLTLKMPEGAPESLQRAIEEGRGKMKKKLMPILMLIGVKLAALLPLALGVIGLMALKALFVGKIAFIIAAIIAAQKFFAGGGSIASFGKAPEAWSSGASSGWSSGAASSGPYYRRSLDKPSSAHEMAYSAQVPAQYEADPQ